MQFIRNLLAIVVFLSLMLGVAGCQSEPLPVPPPPPPPAATTSNNTQTQTETSPPTTEPVETPTPVSGTNITSNLATVSFPDSITFSLKGTSNPAVKTIVLEYGSDKRSLVAEINKIEPEFQEGIKIDASWSWEMKKMGSLPPGATVWWQWKITDIEGNTTVVPKQSMTYQDTRFQWQITELATMDIYWQDQNATLKQELTAELESKLSRIELNVSIPAERKPKIFVYTSSEQLRGAMLHEQEWTGAVAYSNYNIILTAVDTATLEWAKRALPHEITHLLVGEFIFGPFGDIPHWLNEGLARYSEGTITEYDRQLLNKAFDEGSLISVRSLASSFPTDPGQAYLAYAEAGSIVTFLIENFGWEKMRQLLSVFKEGSTYDKALQEVYGFDTNGLEAQWQEYLGKNR